MDKRELLLDLLARDRTGPGTRSAGKNLGDVADRADDAKKSTSDFGKAAVIAGQQGEKFGRSARTAANLVGGLDVEIGRVEQNLVFLAQSFAETSDAAERLDISKGIRKAENELRRLNKSKGLLAGLLPEVDPAAGQAVGRSLAQSIRAGIASSGSSIATAAGGSVGPVVGGAVGAAAGPVLVSALGSALSAGIGAGVLGAGVALAVKSDTQLQAAGKEAGSKFSKSLQREAATAFKGPLLESIEQLSDAGDRSARKLGQAFSALAPQIKPLTADLITAGDRITDSLVGVARNSGPALDGLGDSIVLLTDGVSGMMEELSDGGPEAAANLRLVAGATGDLLEYSGRTLKLFGDLANNEWITGPLLPILRKHYAETAEDSGKLGGKTQELASHMTNAEKATSGQREALAELNAEIRAQTDPLFAFANAQDKVEQAQEKVNNAIRKHGPNSEAAADATRELAGAALDLQGRAAEVGTTADGKLTPALHRALIQANLTEGEIRGVEKELKSAKAALDRYDGTTAVATVRVDGVAAARQAAKRISDTLASIKDETVWVNYITSGGYSSSALRAAYNKQAGAGDRREFGGPVKAGHAYIVGEKRAEVFVPDRDGKIIPSLEQYARAGSGTSQAAAGTYAPAAVPALRLDVTGAEGKFKEWIRELFRTGGL